jgi:hypothetical protein
MSGHSIVPGLQPMVKEDNTKIQSDAGWPRCLNVGKLVDDCLKTRAMHQFRSLIEGRIFDKAVTLCHLTSA